MQRLFAPRHVAVVGGGFWCRNLIRALQDFGFAGPVWHVHPSAPGAFRDLADLPQAPDAVFLGVNRQATVEYVRILSKMGAGGAVCFASGFAEMTDGASADLQSELVAAARGMPILGPNCYGFVNGFDRVALWPDQHGLVPRDRGVAIVAQSSNIAINLTMQARGLPVAAVVTLGNQAQTGLADVVDMLVADPRITAIGLYLEGIGDLAAFERMARAAAARRVPVVVLKAGFSAEAQAATLSHTASLAGSAAGASALFQRFGLAEVESPAVLLETLALLHGLGPLAGNALASMSCSGGEASLVADLAARRGDLVFPPLTEAQIAGLGAALGPKVTLGNPLDYHTYIWGDIAAMTACYAAMLAGDQDIALVIVDMPHALRADPGDWDCVATAAQAAAAQTGRPLALVSTLPEGLPEPLGERLEGHAIVALHGLPEALAAIAAAGKIRFALDPAPLVLPAPASCGATLTEGAAKALLAAAHVPVPTSHQAATPSEAAEMARRITGNLVLKGQGIAHKSEAGAVVLGLQPDQVEAAAACMPAASFLIEEMIMDGVAELLVGVLRDPAHGFVLTLGAGGTETEIRKDTTSLLVPARRADIRQALTRLRIWPLLTGFLGRPAADLDAVLDAIERICAIVAQTPTLYELEINPLICTPGRAVAADALITLGEPA